MEQQPSADVIEIEIDLPPGMEAEDGTVDKRRINTPDRQNTTIPQGWKPTVRKPIPVVRCVHVWPDGHERQGERCNKWSLRGSQRCYFHSGRGNLKNVEQYRQAIIEAARLQLTESVPDAMDWLYDLGAHSTADNVRLKAATEILDRGGLKSVDQIEIDLHVSDGLSPAAALAERLDKLKKAADFIAEHERKTNSAALELAAARADTADADVVDAEIVEDDG